jgi:hypothetical protein
MKRFTVFYAGLVYEESDYALVWSELPEDCLVYDTVNTNWPFGKSGWFRKDKTPVLIEDVPKELLTYLLIL